MQVLSWVRGRLFHPLTPLGRSQVPLEHHGEEMLHSVRVDPSQLSALLGLVLHCNVMNVKWVSLRYFIDEFNFTPAQTNSPNIT
jgi:hypothetical protein